MLTTAEAQLPPNLVRSLLNYAFVRRTIVEKPSPRQLRRKESQVRGTVSRPEEVGGASALS